MSSNKEKRMLETLRAWRESPVRFIRDVWGLEPPFGEFTRGKHITLQQYQMLLAVEKAIRGEAPKRISIAAGTGIGKSSLLSWLGIWFLFMHKDSIIPCTAPSSTQLFDVLWKEYSKWISAMPPSMKSKFEWTATHIRMVDRPQTWFATARTAKRENPEALAGFHADNLMVQCDEASGVFDEIYEKAEGALTSPNAWIILISNPTRNIGYFYDTHNHATVKNIWQRFQFSAYDSPLVPRSSIEEKMAKYGESSDEFGYMVLGKFPRIDAMDARGYMPLFLNEDIKQTADERGFVGAKLGVDPSKEGRNETIWVVRDQFKAKIVAREPISTPKGIAQKTLTLMDYYGISSENVVIDNFGVGANVSQELALMDVGLRVHAVNVGEKATDDLRFMNKRAENYWRLKEWLRSGGELVRGTGGWEDLLHIRYRRTMDGKIQIMSKKDMAREGYQSPDVPDALALTFSDPEQRSKYELVENDEESMLEEINLY